MNLDVDVAASTSTAAPAVPVSTPAESPPAPLAMGLHNVSRRFGTVQALDDLTLEVPLGQITVLLGPNGAGKTTAIRMVTGALEPDTGQVSVFGLDPAVDGEDVRRRCGVVSAKPALYDRLSGFDNLRYAADLYGLTGNADARILEAAERFGIAHTLDNQVGGYSTGMKTRLALSRSILHGPELLLFDEPTSGLDPESAAAVLALIRQMTVDGHTVLMCTHHLLEAEGLADRVIVLDGGTDLLSGAPNDLCRRYWPDPVVKFEAVDPTGLEALKRLPGVRRFDGGDGLPGSPLVTHVQSLDRVPELIEGLMANGVRLTRVEPWEPTLEDLYFAVRAEHRETTKQRRQADVEGDTNLVRAGRASRAFNRSVL